MFSTRTTSVMSALVMVMAMAAHAHAKDKRHAKDDDEEEDDDDDSSAKAKAKAKAKEKEKEKAKAKAREQEEQDEDDSESEKARAKDKEKAKEKAKAAEMEAEKEVDKEKENAASGGGGDETYHDGTLGISIPFGAIGGALGGAGGEPVSAVDVNYFLDESTALDLIAGLNFHRKSTTTTDAAGNTTTATANLIGLAVGLGYRMYSFKNNLRSYIEPQAVISIPDVSNVGTSLGINLGGSFGLERTVTPWFSVSASVGASLNLINKFKDIQLSTNAKLAANLYWR